MFENNNGSVVADLVDFMYVQEKNSVWIAHNGGRFDTVFLLRELLINRNIVPKVIMNGNKIMCMELEECNLKVIDSFLFLSMALSKFPDALGIPNLAKGFHPYHFTDLTYEGPMIGLEYFDPPAKGTGQRRKFDTWYAEQLVKPYNFKKAIYYYCRLDVDILRQGCIVFARLIKEITSVFPFYDKTCHTIAGLALKIYRCNFLVKDTIGQIPAQGYGGNINQTEHVLHSALSPQGEMRILGHPVDGYCEETRTIYQFHGCFYHGCRACYESDEYNTVLNETFYTLRERTRRTTDLFASRGYTVVSMWECDFKRERNLSKTTINLLRHRDFFINTRLNPCDALFGGRTSPARLYFEARADERAFYADFTSLDLFVQKKYVYPTRHPTIICGEEKCREISVENIFGLLFPVLPCRAGVKLTFPLCRA